VHARPYHRGVPFVMPNTYTVIDTDKGLLFCRSKTLKKTLQEWTKSEGVDVVRGFILNFHIHLSFSRLLPRLHLG